MAKTRVLIIDDSALVRSLLDTHRLPWTRVAGEGEGGAEDGQVAAGAEADLVAQRVLPRLVGKAVGDQIHHTLRCTNLGGLSITNAAKKIEAMLEQQPQPFYKSC